MHIINFTTLAWKAQKILTFIVDILFQVIFYWCNQSTEVESPPSGTGFSGHFHVSQPSPSFKKPFRFNAFGQVLFPPAQLTSFWNTCILLLESLQHSKLPNLYLIILHELMLQLASLMYFKISEPSWMCNSFLYI